jgi:hypothetical protein
MLYDPINDNRIWRTRYNNELYTLYDELDTVGVIKIERLGWLGQPFRMQELDPYGTFTVRRPEGTRRAQKS